MLTHHASGSRRPTIHPAIAIAIVIALAAFDLAAQQPGFELVQPDLFAASGGQPNAWADVDGDDDLDLFVGFRDGTPNRLYQNAGGQFTDVAVAMGVADVTDTRAAAWGDFDADGDIDLFVGFTRKSNAPARLYRNDGPGKGFTDVAAAVGVVVTGEIRQSSFVDIDGDQDLDLFVAVRDAPNMLFRNDGGRFVSVGRELGLDDPRRTVGAVWFDMDMDGDLDLFVANQNGDLNGLFRNDRPRFVDVAGELGVAAAGRAPTSGSNGPSVADFDNDVASTCSSLGTAATTSIATTGRAGSPSSPRRSASRVAARRHRRAGATSTTTGASISTCRPMTRRRSTNATSCSATRAGASPMC